MTELLSVLSSLACDEVVLEEAAAVAGELLCLGELAAISRDPDELHELRANLEEATALWDELTRRLTNR